MKNKSALQLVLICLFTALAFAIWSSSALAQTPTCAQTTTTCWTGHTGDWFNPLNWSRGVPTLFTDAVINNAGTAQINLPGAVARTLTLGVNLGDSGTVTVNGTTGGSLQIPGAGAEAPATIFQGLISVGYGGKGSLSINNGGTVTAGYGYIAALRGSGLLTSNGSVTVDGSGSAFTISDQAIARLFIGGSFSSSGDDAGGTALLIVKNGGTVDVNNPANQTSVKVGVSGTLTGNGTITTHGVDPNKYLSYVTAIQGTLAPTGGFNITQDLGFASFGTMLCNVTPGSADNVKAGGTALLQGRVSVIMTGTFTNGTTRYTLLDAEGGWQFNYNRFDSVSITYPTNQGFTPQITYDDNIPSHVYLDLLFNE